jgi:thiol:disulfide interchange protein DsbA
MAKKKRKLPEKETNLTRIYVVLALLFIAALLIFFSGTAHEKPIEKLQTGKVKIIEFFKFDCIHCYNLHKNLPKVLEKYGDNVTITYVPVVWPGQSNKSIEACYISEEMGKGEEMRDALFRAKFENGTDVIENVTALEEVAASIGLGSDFNVKLEGNYARKAALLNLELMNKYGVQATPAIIINENLLVNPPTAANLDSIIASLLS